MARTTTVAEPPACLLLRLPSSPIAGRSKHTAEYQGLTYAFCDPGCRKAFQKDPARFLAPDYVPSM